LFGGHHRAVGSKYVDAAMGKLTPFFALPASNRS
jgi:hypothetical protein